MQCYRAGKRKSGDEHTADIRVERSKHPGKLFDGIERGIHLDKKLFAQAAALLFIPLVGGSQVSSNAAAKDDGQRHQFRLASASTWSRLTTSSGLRICSASRSSSTARWASPIGIAGGSAERLVQSNSMRRNRSSTGNLRISATSVSLMIEKAITHAAGPPMVDQDRSRCPKWLSSATGAHSLKRLFCHQKGASKRPENPFSGTLFRGLNALRWSDPNRGDPGISPSSAPSVPLW